MAISLSRASLYCTFIGVVVFCLFTISSYVHIHLLLHFRNYTTIHPGIDSGGGGDVEVLAYVNSNLIVIHDEPQPLVQRVSSSSSSSSVPSSSSTSPTLAIPLNLTKEASGVTLVNNNEAVMTQAAALLTKASDIKVEKKSDNAKPKSSSKAVAETILTNFTVSGWPQSKSRIATDYVNYDEDTATIVPSVLLPVHLSSTNPQILIAVQSAPGNEVLRSEVRRTYGGACKTTHKSWCSLVFVIGQCGRQQQAKLEEESVKYGDLLQESFLDSYNNLTIKSIHILKYFVSVSEPLGNNQFLLKTDDDSFVHLEALWDLAKARMEKKSNNLIGFLQLGLKKHHYLPLAHKPTTSNLKRKQWEKWLVPTYMYNKRFFPQFLSGSGYLVSRSASECLLEKSKTVPIVHLEDVYITGLCAASCHLRREHNKGFKARPMDKIASYQIQETDIVLHYTTGQMDRLFDQVIQLKQETIDPMVNQ